MISVICPIYNEANNIKTFAESILQQDYPQKDMEVLFVDGMSTDKTRQLLQPYCETYNNIRLIDNPQKTVPYAMNAAIREAKGDIIIRVDAHAVYPRYYFSQLVYYLTKLPQAENVGGVCITLPCNESHTAYAIAEALSSSFGMGNSYFRIGAKDIIETDTVPFGCFRKSIFDRIGLYDLELTRNQDDEFNGRIIKNGGKIYLIPTIQTSYYARDKIAKIRNMFYQYGLYKPLVNKKLGSPATLRQFVPPLFTLSLIVGTLIGLVFRPFLWLTLTILLLHLLVGTILGIKTAIKLHRIAMIALMPFLFLNIHLSYGWGYLMGIYKTFNHKSISVEANR